MYQYDVIYIYTLWLFNIALENGPFIDDFLINTSIYKGFSIAMLNNQMVYIYIYSFFTSSSCRFHGSELENWSCDFSSVNLATSWVRSWEAGTAGHETWLSLLVNSNLIN